MPGAPSSRESGSSRRKRSSPTRLLDITPAEPARFRNLTVFPLVSEGSGNLYTLLPEALAAGLVTIGEMGSGVVPTLLARNAGDVDVLVLDGEQLIGAKQNRITNRSIILAAKSVTEIPVSCMEQGRWRVVSEEFTPRPRPMHAASKVRRHARHVEAACVGVGQTADHRVLAEAQGAVWNEIGVSAGRLGVHSDTGAMSELYDRREEDLASWVKRFPAQDGQVGLLAFLGESVLGLDAVGHPDLYAQLHERLLGGYVMDAIVDRGESKGSPTARAAATYLSRVGEAKRGAAPTVGKGSYHVLTGTVVGGELADADTDAGAGTLAHLSAFPGLPSVATETRRVDAAPLRGPTARRRGHL